MLLNDYSFELNLDEMSGNGNGNNFDFEHQCQFENIKNTVSNFIAE